MTRDDVALFIEFPKESDVNYLVEGSCSAAQGHSLWPAGVRGYLEILSDLIPVSGLRSTGICATVFLPQPGLIQSKIDDPVIAFKRSVVVLFKSYQSINFSECPCFNTARRRSI